MVKKVEVKEEVKEVKVEKSIPAGLRIDPPIVDVEIKK